MMPNFIKRRWTDHEPALNGWLSIGNAFSAEIVGHAGYDSVTIDIQHGALDYEAAIAMFQSLRPDRVSVMARVPQLDAAMIGKALDLGALGIICPMINTADDAARLVSYATYPPTGIRSYGPTRALFVHGDDYRDHVEDDLLIWAMIETAEAFANLGEIVKTPGLSGIYIGPADLTLGLTGRQYRPGFDRREPEMVAAIKHIIATTQGAGLRVGLHTGAPAYAAEAMSWGCDLVTLPNDVRLLAAAATASVRDTWHAWRSREASENGNGQP